MICPARVYPFVTPLPMPDFSEDFDFKRGVPPSQSPSTEASEGDMAAGPSNLDANLIPPESHAEQPKQLEVAPARRARNAGIVIGSGAPPTPLTPLAPQPVFQGKPKQCPRHKGGK